MAEERTITTVFKADISNFSASTQQLNRYMSLVNAEFKNSTASMTRWNDNSEGLRAKLTQLNKTLDAQDKQLKLLEDQYNGLTDEQKKNTRAGQNLAKAINEQSAKVKETKKNIDFYTGSLKELEDAGVSTKAELEQLKKAAEEAAKAEKKAQIEAEKTAAALEKELAKAAEEAAKALEKELADAEKKAAKEIEEANKKLEEQKQAAKELGSGILKGAAAGIAGIGAACIGAMAGLGSLVEETKELRTQMGMLETTFGQQGLSVEAAEKTYGDLFSVLGESDQATEAAQHLAQMAKDEKELEQMTNTLTGVYATFGNSLPVEGLAEAMNHTAKLGEVQGPLADALEWSGVNVDTFNEELANLNTEEERAAHINSTLNGIYGETAAKYKEVNKDVLAANEAQNKYNQAMADIGEKAQPAITSFKTAMVGVLQTIMEKFSEVDIEGLIGKISGAITNLINVVLPPLMTALTWILDNANWLVPVLGSLVGIIGAISAGIKIYNAVVKVARAVQLAWNLALSANPVGLVITAIGLLVVAFVTLWNKCEGFRKFFINMFEKIKAVATSVAEFIGGIFEGIINTIKGVINGVISLINGAIKAINKISVDIPDWVPGFGGKKFGFDISLIPKLAEGAVIDKPTLAMVGEAGKEVVMPLENNTQWIDKLAERLNAQGRGGNKTYNITNKFERMETTRLAMHKANLETKRMLREV